MEPFDTPTLPRNHVRHPNWKVQVGGGFKHYLFSRQFNRIKTSIISQIYFPKLDQIQYFGEMIQFDLPIFFKCGENHHQLANGRACEFSGAGFRESNSLRRNKVYLEPDFPSVCKCLFQFGCWTNFFTWKMGCFMKKHPSIMLVV